VGEIPYIWEENKEILMTDSDAKEFAKKVSLILDSSELSNSLSLNARTKAETFDRSKIKEKWVDLLEKI